VTFPYGQFSFTSTSAPGGLVTFTLTLPGPVNGFYKLSAGAWASFTFDGVTGARVNGNVITVTIRDNGRGDADPALGSVSDPGAPALFNAAIPGTGSNTTAPLSVAALLVLLGLLTVMVGRRRRPAT
jgi:LPXTG-motif cell wall-anchored protein